MTDLDFYKASVRWKDHLEAEIKRAEQYAYEAVKKLFPKFEDTSEAAMREQYELWRDQGWKEIEDQDRGTGSISDIVRQRIEIVKDEKILMERLWKGYNNEWWWYNDNYYLCVICGASDGWKKGWRECVTQLSQQESS